MTRAHFRLALAAGIAAVACIATPWLVTAWVGYLPAGIGFRCLLVLILAANLEWWTLADHTLRTMLSRGRTATTLRIMQAAVSALAVAVIIAILVLGRGGVMSALPVWLIGSIQMWHMGLAALMPGALVLAASLAIGIVLTRRIRKYGATPSRTAPPPEDSSECVPEVSRRQWLTAVTVYTPSVICGAASVASVRESGHFQVNEYDLAAPWLPRRLAGLTIAHVSDLHLGRLYRPNMLPQLVDAVNRMTADLIVVTGDIIDMSNDMLPAAISAFRQFEHRHGLFLCIGNHDLIDNRTVFINAWRDANIKLLINQRRLLRIGGESLTVAGLDWSPRDAGVGHFVSHADHVSEMLRDFDKVSDGPCITLAHHPHAFDALGAAGIPLTLSGHTHGGQIMWRSPGPDGQSTPADDAGIGRLMFRYVRGFYRAGASTLFVNRGVGNWFPLRLNAAAEIVRIRLT